MSKYNSQKAAARGEHTIATALRSPDWPAIIQALDILQGDSIIERTTSGASFRVVESQLGERMLQSLGIKPVEPLLGRSAPCFVPVSKMMGAMLENPSGVLGKIRELTDRKQPLSTEGYLSAIDGSASNVDCQLEIAEEALSSIRHRMYLPVRLQDRLTAYNVWDDNRPPHPEYILADSDKARDEKKLVLAKLGELKRAKYLPMLRQPDAATRMHRGEILMAQEAAEYEVRTSLEKLAQVRKDPGSNELANAVDAAILAHETLALAKKALETHEQIDREARAGRTPSHYPGDGTYTF